MQAWIVSLLALTGTSLAAPTYSYASSSSSAYAPAATEYSNDYSYDDNNDWSHDKKDTSVKVILAGGYKHPVETSFEHAGQWREEKRPHSHGPFKTVELALGKDFQPQTLRCQILDKHHQPIVIVRGENIDTTFADGDKGKWTFKDGEKEVSKIICDPTFVANPQQPAPPIENKDTSVRVQLSGPGELASQTPFNTVGAQGGKEILPPVASNGPFDTVQLTLGADVKNPALRCRLTDKKGQVITLKRGESIQNTFASGNPWTFLHPAESEVGKIECNDQFVLGSP